jgi:hypothetical protein
VNIRNLVVGFFLGAGLIGSYVYAETNSPALSEHFAAVEQADIERCFDAASAADSKTEVSFKLTEDGIDYNQAVCWPDGIAISDK